jgi:hypothetical protein
VVELSRDGRYFCRIFFLAKGLVEVTAAHCSQQEGKTRNVVRTANIKDSKIISMWKPLGWINANFFLREINDGLQKDHFY